MIPTFLATRQLISRNMITIVLNVSCHEQIYSSAFNPKLRKANADEDKDEDKIDLFGDNPNWEPGWVKAYRINALGQE